MSPYIIMTDAALNIDLSVIDRNDIHVIPMFVSVADREFSISLDTPREDIDAYYKLLVDHPAYTTQISLGIYEAYFEKFVEEGQDILYLSMSGELSATFVQSKLAAEHVVKDHPGAKILCLDSKTCTSGGTHMAKRAIDNLKQGMSIEENLRDLEAFRSKVTLYGYITSLDHLKRSGRLSGAQALFGSALNIRPILHINEKGELILQHKVRGTKQAIKYIVDHINDEIDASETVCYINHGDDLNSAKKVKQQLLKKTPLEEIYIDTTSPIISAHIGQGAISATFIAK
ncbi:MAG: DegV family protein [Peptoniphilus sp.]|nr:DegV family protein [Peptoniphilus sp.]MDY6045202.1 DegV family protein [Peptoniphilus sp.]